MPNWCSASYAIEGDAEEVKGGIRSGQAEGEAAGKQRLKMEKIVRVIAPLAAGFTENI